MNEEALTVVRCTRYVAASPEQVFDAWVTPAAIAKWLVSPSPSDEVVGIQVDPRLDGAFSFQVRRGGQVIDHVGEYVEWDRPKLLAFTFDAGLAGEVPVPSRDTGSRVRIELTGGKGGTDVALTVDRVPRSMAERTQAGWTRILEAVHQAIMA